MESFFRMFLANQTKALDNMEDIYNVFETIGKNPAILKEMSGKAYLMANEELDYHVIYRKILHAVGME